MRMLNVLSRLGKVTACVTECDGIPPLSVTIAIRTKSGWADLFVKIRHTILPVFVFLHHNEDLGIVLRVLVVDSWFHLQSQVGYATK